MIVFGLVCLFLSMLFIVLANVGYHIEKRNARQRQEFVEKFRHYNDLED